MVWRTCERWMVVSHLMLVVFAHGTAFAVAAQSPSTAREVPRPDAQRSANGLPPAPSPVVLQPGDAVRIAVFRNPELTGDFQIADDGTIAHPLYRMLNPVTGVPMAEVQSRLRRFIGEFTKADSLFVIVPLLRVVVSGDVRSPNVYRLPPETSLSQAIAVAGGQTELGRRDRALLIRDGRETTVDLRGAAPMGQAPIRSGDQIAIERERSAFRDWVLPTVALVGSIAAIVNVFLNNR